MNENLREPAYLKRTIEAIQKLTLNKMTNVITVKNIRQLRNIKGSNRSAIVFYGLGLGFLEKRGVLRIINHGSPKKYMVIDQEKLKILAEG